MVNKISNDREQPKLTTWLQAFIFGLGQKEYNNVKHYCKCSTHFGLWQALKECDKVKHLFECSIYTLISQWCNLDHHSVDWKYQLKKAYLISMSERCPYKEQVYGVISILFFITY